MRGKTGFLSLPVSDSVSGLEEKPQTRFIAAFLLNIQL